MNNATDTRIVQMQFDNKQFERNIKISEKSLDKFKKALDFSKCEKSLDNLSAATEKLKFDRMSDNIQKLTDKFTGLGTVSELVLSQIRRGIESTAAKISGMINQLGFEQISVGKTKFEELNKNIKTIMGATGLGEAEVMKVMERLNAYTDQTSYNFTDMASNIGKFTSVGIGLQDAEKEMEGIANWAARSGAGIQEASRAMYNLSQAMGMGKLLQRDWYSIENANMATKEFKEQLIEAGLAAKTLTIDKDGVIKTAKELGKQVEVNYQNLRDTLNKGWANREVMEKALLNYYYDDLYYEGEKVIQLTEQQLKENEELFKDHQLDFKEWGTLVKNEEINEDVKKAILDVAVEQKKLVKETDKNGKTIYKVVTKNGKQIEVTLDNMAETLSYGWLDKSVARRVGLLKDLGEESYKAAQKCTTLTDVFNAWKDQLSTGWMKVWQNIFGGMTESMELFSAICDKVSDSFSSFIETLVGDGEKLDGIFGMWSNLGGRDSLWSMFVGEYDGMYEGAYGILDALKDIGSMISKGFWDMVYTIYSVMDDNPITLDEWSSEANADFRNQFLGARIKDATDNIRNFIQSVKDFMTEIPEGAKKSRFEQIQDVVSGVMSIAVLVYNTVKDITGFLEVILDQNHLGPAVDSIIQIFSMLGQELSNAATESSKGEGLGYFLNQLLDVLGNKDEGLIKSFNDFMGFLQKLIGWLVGANSEESRSIQLWHILADFWSRKLKKIALVINHIIVPIIGFFEDLLSAGKDLAKGEIDFTGFVDRVKTAIKKAINSIFSFTPNFTGKVKQIFDDIKQVITGGFSKESIDRLTEHVGVIFGDLKKKIPETVKNTLKTVYSAVKTFFTNAWTKIQEFFAPFFADVQNLFTTGFSKGSIERLKTRFRTIFKGISDAIPQGLKGGFNSVLKKVEAYFTKIWTKIQEKIAGVFSGKKEKTGETSETVGRYFRAIFNPKEFGMGSEKTLFERIIDWIRAGFKKVKDFITELFGGVASSEPVKQVQAFADEIIHPGELDTKGGILDKLFGWLKEGFGKISGFIDKIKKQFSGEETTSLFGAIKKLDLSSIALMIVGALGVVGLMKVIKTAVSVVDTILKIGKNITDIPKNISQALHGMPATEAVGDKFLKLAGAIAIVSAALIIIGKMPWHQALQGIIVVGAIMFGMNFILNQLKKTFSKMSEEDLRAFRSGLLGILAIALSTLLISKALIKLGQLDWGAWSRALIAYGVIIAGFWAMSKILEKAKFKWDNMVGLIAFAASIWLLIKALLPMKDVKDPMEWVRMFGSLAIILGELLAFSALSALIEKKIGGGLGGMAQLAALVGAIAALVFALIPLSIMPWKSLFKMVGFLGLILVELGVFVLAVAAIGRLGTMSGSGMGQLAALAGAIAILVLALLPIALLKEEQVKQMVDTLGKIMFLLAAMVALVGFMNKKSANMSKSGMAQLLAVAGAVMMLVLAMIPLAFLKPEQLTRGLVGVITLVVVLALFSALVSHFGGLKDSGTVQLLAVAGAVMLLVLTLIPLSLMKPEQLTQGLFAVIALIGSLALATALISNFGSEAKPAALVALLAVAGAVVLLVLAMVPLSMMPLENLISAVAAIVILMVGMSLVIKALSKLKVSKKDLTNVLMLVALAGVIMIFAVAINMVKDVDPGVMVTLGVGLAAMLVGMAYAIKALQGVNIAAGLQAILLLALGVAAVLAAVGVVVALMAPWILESIGDGLVKMMEKLATVSDMLKDFGSDMDGVSESSLDAAKRKFDILISIIMSMAGIGGYYRDVCNFESAMLKLSNGINQFEFSTKDVGNPEESKAIKYIKAILGLKNELNSFSAGSFAEQAALLGESLSHFGLSATFFGVGYVATNAGIQMVKDLAGQASNLQMLSELPLDKLRENIAGLGGALSIYATGASEAHGLKESDVPDIQKVVELMRSVMTSLGADGGFKEIPEIPDSTSLNTFGTNLAALAIAMTKFSIASSMLGDTSKALSLLTFIGELQGKLTAQQLSVVNAFHSNGVDLNWYTLTRFGLEIEALGTALSKFHNSTKDFKMKKRALKALEFFADLKERLQPVTLTKVQDWNTEFQQVTGDPLTELGNNIGELGEALAKFANDVNFGEDKTEPFENALKALQKFEEIANQLPVLGGIESWFHGEVEHLSTFATDIGELGRGLKNFSENLVDKDGKSLFNVDIAEQALGTLRSFADLARIVGSFGGNEIITNLSQLKTFISTINDDTRLEFFDLGDMERLGGSKSVMWNLVKLMSDLDEIMSEMGGFKNPQYFEAFRNMAEGVSALINIDPTMDFTKVGLNISEGVRKGILEGKDSVCEAIKEVIKAAVTAATSKDGADEHSPSRKFAKIGNFISLGLAQGIDKKASTPVRSAVDMVKATIEASRETAQVQSPSKEFITIGEFLGAGLAIGLNNSIHDVMDASTMMAESSIKAMKDALGIHSPSEEFAKIALMCATGLITDEEKNSRMVSKSFTEGLVDKPIETMREQTEEDLKKLKYYKYAANYNPAQEALNSMIAPVKSISETVDDIVTDRTTRSNFSKIFAGYMIGISAAAVVGMKRAHDQEKKILYEAVHWTAGVVKDIDNRMSNLVPTASDLISDMFGQKPEETELPDASDWIANLIPAAKAAPDVEIDAEATKKNWLQACTDFVKDNPKIFGSLFKGENKDIFGLSTVVEDALHFTPSKSDYDDIYNLGEFINKGLDEGMIEHIIHPVSAIQSVIDAVVKAGYERADAHSPSRIFMTLGGYLSEGLAVGIRKTMGDPEKNTQNLIDVMKQTVLSANLSSILADEINPNPTITPVLDLSNITQGSQYLNSLFGGQYGIGVNPANVPSAPSSIAPVTAGGADRDYTGTMHEIQNEVSELRTDLRTMSEAIRQVKFVMNSGAIVGAIGPDMDRYLGEQGFYAGRLNMP